MTDKNTAPLFPFEKVPSVLSSDEKKKVKDKLAELKAAEAKAADTK